MKGVAVSWCFGDRVSSDFMISTQMMFNHDSYGPGHVRAIIVERSPVNITQARNNLIRKFLNKSEAEWLLMLDSDMVVPADLIDRLMEDAVGDIDSEDYTPFIGGLCFTINDNGDIHPTIYNWSSPGSSEAVDTIHSYDYGKTLEVGATGAACLLMHRSSLEKIYERHSDDLFPWFKEFQHNGSALSEDLGFMRRIADCGFKVRVNTDIKVGHFKSFIIDEPFYRMQNPAAK
jgi:hypothetical protein